MTTHFDDSGHPRMVDVTEKPVTARTATAQAVISMRPETLEMISRGEAKKGDVLAVARLAAIQATKHAALLIPLCHPLPVEGVDVVFEFPDNRSVRCSVTVRTTARTGVEMEALSAATVAALTVYDMCKSVDRAMEIGSVHLVRKVGGASGTYEREETPRGHGG